METTRSRLAALVAFGGLAFIAVAAVNLAAPPLEGGFDSTSEYLREVFSLLAIALTVPGIFLLRELQGAPRGSVEMAAAGQSLIVAGIAAGLVIGEAPSWFMALGAPGLLLWLIGTVRIAGHTWRAGRLPRWTAIGIGLTVPVGMVMGEIGGSLLPGALWLYLAATKLPLTASHATARHASSPRPAAAARP